MSFKYSLDPLIKHEQQEKAAELIRDLSGQFNLRYASEIDQLFHDIPINSYQKIEDVSKIAKINGMWLITVISPRNYFSNLAQEDLAGVFKLMNKKITETLPYIEYSFPDDYDSPYGENSKSAFIFFFTLFENYEESKDIVIKYITKFYKLQSFV